MQATGDIVEEGGQRDATLIQSLLQKPSSESSIKQEPKPVQGKIPSCIQLGDVTSEDTPPLDSVKSGDSFKFLMTRTSSRFCRN
jgi:hypothetical protein